MFLFMPLGARPRPSCLRGLDPILSVHVALFAPQSVHLGHGRLLVTAPRGRPSVHFQSRRCSTQPESDSPVPKPRHVAAPHVLSLLPPPEGKLTPSRGYQSLGRRSHLKHSQAERQRGGSDGRSTFPPKFFILHW